jgi:hypothetical protein
MAGEFCLAKYETGKNFTALTAAATQFSGITGSFAGTPLAL